VPFSAPSFAGRASCIRKPGIETGLFDVFLFVMDDGLREAMASTLSVSPARKRRRAATAMPVVIDPMLAVQSELPAHPERFSFEFKWDGVRALCFWDGKTLRLQGRAGNDITARYPELHRIGEAIGPERAILDGEIVALDAVDRPSFALLQQRMHLSDARSIERVSKQVPVLYVIFDLLYLDRQSLMDQPLSGRRAALEELTLAGASWQVSPAHVGDGESMLATAQKNQLEGIVAKELDSTYEPGRRSPAWRKIKLVQRQEFVVGGWTTGNNGRGLGAMLVGYFEHGKFRYAGKVGSGFTQKSLAEMEGRLTGLSRASNPFSEPVPGAGLAPGRWTRSTGAVHFVEPKTIVEIEYRRWPLGGLIQQAAYKGLRTDKRARDVVKEA
jgi:bifunctional non-homologous end joining protein LigD